MDLIDEVIDDPSCVFIFPEPEKLRPPLLRIEEGYYNNIYNLVISPIILNQLY